MIRCTRSIGRWVSRLLAHHQRRLLLLLVTASALAVGCEDYYDEDGVTLGPPCENTSIVDLAPIDGQTDMFVGGWLFAQLACEVPGSRMELSTPAGVAIKGVLTSHHQDTQLRFRPSSRLAPATFYEANLDTHVGFRNWSFSTSSFGSPATASIRDLSLRLDPSEAKLLDPIVAKDALLDGLQGARPILQFTSETTASGVACRVGGADDDDKDPSQDLNFPTVDYLATWTNPFFRIGPTRIAWPTERFEFILESGVISGAISQSATIGGGASLEGLWDTRPADSTVGTGPSSLCALSEATGGPSCQSCQDGAIYCLPFLLVHGDWGRWEGQLSAVD